MTTEFFFYTSQILNSFLLRLEFPASLYAFQNILPTFVKLELGDDNLRWVDTEGNGLARGLLLDNTLDVNNIF